MPIYMTNVTVSQFDIQICSYFLISFFAMNQILRLFSPVKNVSRVDQNWRFTSCVTIRIACIFLFKFLFMTLKMKE